mmetsp:Transcript_88002/g.188816  ORF Transcript_88002/g.188816 Transcript_88002/m.188816 type:complete len:179 (-) Transcript_88002:69-605(-)
MERRCMEIDGGEGSDPRIIGAASESEPESDFDEYPEDWCAGWKRRWRANSNPDELMSESVLSTGLRVGGPCAFGLQTEVQSVRPITAIPAASAPPSLDSCSSGVPLGEQQSLPGLWRPSKKRASEPSLAEVMAKQARRGQRMTPRGGGSVGSRSDVCEGEFPALGGRPSYQWPGFCGG